MNLIPAAVPHALLRWKLDGSGLESVTASDVLDDLRGAVARPGQRYLIDTSVLGPNEARAETVSVVEAQSDTVAGQEPRTEPQTVTEIGADAFTHFGAFDETGRTETVTVTEAAVAQLAQAEARTESPAVAEARTEKLGAAEPKTEAPTLGESRTDSSGSAATAPVVEGWYASANTHNVDLSIAGVNSGGANRYLVALIAQDNQNASNGSTPPGSFTVSGGGLTWTRRAFAPGVDSFGGSLGAVEIWTAPAPAQLSAVTVTATVPSQNGFAKMWLAVCAGASGVGAFTSEVTSPYDVGAAPMQLALPVGAVAASIAFFVGSDFYVATARTPISGQTVAAGEIDGTGGTAADLWVQTLPSTAGGAQTMGVTAPAGGGPMAVLELKH